MVFHACLTLIHLSHWQGPINGFDFEVGSDDAPIQDDPALEDYNVRQRVELFVIECLEKALTMKTVWLCGCLSPFLLMCKDNIMLTMGTDFNYQNANTWFKNIDKLIHYVNQDVRF